MTLARIEICNRIQLAPKKMQELRQLLLGGEPFKALARFFIEGAVEDSGGMSPGTKTPEGF